MIPIDEQHFGITHAGSSEPVLSTNDLFSCVALTLYNPKHHVAALAHYSLGNQYNSHDRHSGSIPHHALPFTMFKEEISKYMGDGPIIAHIITGAPDDDGGVKFRARNLTVLRGLLEVIPNITEVHEIARPMMRAAIIDSRTGEVQALTKQELKSMTPSLEAQRESAYDHPAHTAPIAADRFPLAPQFIDAPALETPAIPPPQSGCLPECGHSLPANYTTPPASPIRLRNPAHQPAISRHPRRHLVPSRISCNRTRSPLRSMTSRG